MTQQTVFENTLAVPSTLTLQDRERIELEAKRLQAKAVAQTATVVGRAVWWGIKWFGGGIAAFATAVNRAITARHTFETLNRLSDRQLEDIGLTRDGIRDRIQLILDGAETGSRDHTDELVAVDGGLSGKPRKPRYKAPRRRAA